MATVLVVDDNFANRLYIAELVRALGHVPLLASNAAEARELASRADLIVVDLRLPDGDGASVVRAIRQTQARHVIAILSTATQRDAMIDDLMTATKIDFFLQKPSEPQNAMEVLRRAVDRATKELLH